MTHSSRKRTAVTMATAHTLRVLTVLGSCGIVHLSRAFNLTPAVLSNLVLKSCILQISVFVERSSGLLCFSISVASALHFRLVLVLFLCPPVLLCR
jgi:hypothetical protein